MTKAMAVAGVALSAATGCITVSGNPAGPGAGSPSHHSPSTGRGAGPPQLVRPTDKEALSKLPHQGGASGRKSGGGPQKGRDSSGDPLESRTVPGPAARPGQQPAPGSASLPRPPRGQAPAAGGSEGHGHRRQGAERRGGAGVREHHFPGRRHQGPARPGTGSGGGPGVCELGEAYGRWEADSPQARICRHAYGR
jgi:hypothetical protein